MNEFPESLNRLQPETEPAPVFNPNTRILVVCMHGQSRSKYVAKALGRLGYENSSIFGINDPNNPDDLEEILNDIDVVISAGLDDVGAALVNKYPEAASKKLLNCPISEPDHGVLRSQNQAKIEEVMAKISTNLNSLGFISQKNHP